MYVFRPKRGEHNEAVYTLVLLIVVLARLLLFINELVDNAACLSTFARREVRDL